MKDIMKVKLVHIPVEHEEPIPSGKGYGGFLA